MRTPGSAPGGSVWPILAALVAFVMCCAGPAVVALLAAAGFGSVLAPSGPYLAYGAAAAVLTVAVVLWRRRRACRASGPASAAGQRRLEAGTGGTPRRDRAGIP